MVIELPRELTRATLGPCLYVAASITNCDDDTVQVDASQLRFIDPFGLTILAAACERIGQSGRFVEVVALNPIYGGYLERMDLFRHDWLRCDVQRTEGYRTDARAKLVELKRLTAPREVDPAANALASALLGWVPDLSEHAPLDEMTGYNDWTKTHEPLCHTFTELLQNAVTHAKRVPGFWNANVWVTAQYLEKVDRIHIGIVDTGGGFLATLNNHPQLSLQTDEAAILLALQPRISCNRSLGAFADVDNAGIGLTTAARIVRAVHGRMTIVSGEGVVRLGLGNVDPATQKMRRWQGAAIAIDLPRARLQGVDIRSLMPVRDIGRAAPAPRFE